MPLVQAYECPRTKKLFTSAAEYRKHLRKLAAANLITVARKRRLAEMAEKMATLYECPTIADIEQWVMANPKLVFWNCVEGSQSSYRFRNLTPQKLQKSADEFEITSFELKVSYLESCSNSHNAPEGQKTNWHRDKSLPMGYPGWYGRFHFTMAKESLLSFDIMAPMLMKTGTAGAGQRGASGEVTLFAEDWPVLSVHHRLSGE